MRPSTRPVHSRAVGIRDDIFGTVAASGTTVTGLAGCSGSGSTGGGCQRTGLIGGLRVFGGTRRR